MAHHDITESTGHKRNWWPWLPVVGITAVAIPNITFLVIALQVSPDKVTQRPYEEGAAFDTYEDARNRFQLAGASLDHRIIGPGLLQVKLAGIEQVDEAHVYLYRASDEALDRLVAWNDVTQPLEVPGVIQGHWRLRFEGIHEGEIIRYETRARY